MNEVKRAGRNGFLEKHSASFKLTWCSLTFEKQFLFLGFRNNATKRCYTQHGTLASS